ncbi:MAG: TolC family outer membrane protein [Pseudomonadota bacterium]
MLTSKAIAVWTQAVLTSAALVFGATSGSAADTLQDALVSAYKNSNLLEQNRALLRSTDEDVAVAFSALRPQISATSSFGHTDQASGRIGGTLNSSISIGMELLLWDAGRTRLGVEAAKETVLAARARLVDLEQQVLLNAVAAYVGVQRDMRVVSLRENNLRLITQELRAARDRFEVGEVTRTDVAQAEARLAQARGALSEAQGNLAISKELYVATVGKRPGRLSAVPSIPNLPASLDSARAMAERRHPLIAQAQHEITAGELNAARAKAAMRPTIGMSASAGHDRNRDNNSSIGFQMTVPIYQGGQLKALERKAMAQVHAARSGLNQTVLQIRQNVADSWSRLAVANAQLRASDRQISAAQVAFNGVREETRLGARTTLDVLDAEQSLFDARTNRVVFETQVYQAAYQLLSAMGVLTVSDLKLPVRQYDPSEYYNAVKTAPVPITKQGKQLDRILGRYQK